MDQGISISTPESLEFSHEPAGVGSRFVALYYRLSPPVADVISGNSFLRTMVRECLVDPVVWMVEATGDIWRE